MTCIYSIGERRIRVHTLALPITSKLQDVYANADPQAIATLLSKMGLLNTFVIDKFCTVVRRIFELAFRTVVLRRSDSDERLQSETSVRKLFSLRCKTYQFVKLFL